MVKAKEGTVRTPSIRSLRRRIESNLLIQVEKATQSAAPSWQEAQVWIHALQEFRASENGAAPSSNATVTSASGPQAALPGIEG